MVSEAHQQFFERGVHRVQEVDSSQCAAVEHFGAAFPDASAAAVEKDCRPPSGGEAPGGHRTCGKVTGAAWSTRREMASLLLKHWLPALHHSGDVVSVFEAAFEDGQ